MICNAVLIYKYSAGRRLPGKWDYCSLVPVRRIYILRMVDRFVAERLTPQPCRVSELWGAVTSGVRNLRRQLLDLNLNAHLSRLLPEKTKTNWPKSHDQSVLQNFGLGVSALGKSRWCNNMIFR